MINVNEDQKPCQSFPIYMAGARTDLQVKCMLAGRFAQKEKMNISDSQKAIVKAISDGQINCISQFVRFFNLGIESKYSQGGYFSGRININTNDQIYIIDISKRIDIQDFITLVYLLEKNDLIRLKDTEPKQNMAALFMNTSEPNEMLLYECIGYIDKEFRPLTNIREFISNNYLTDKEIETRKNLRHSIIANYLSFGFGALAIAISFFSLSYQINQSKQDISLSKRTVKELVVEMKNELLPIDGYKINKESIQEIDKLIIRE